MKSRAVQGVAALALAGASVLGVTSTASADPNVGNLSYGDSGEGVRCAQHDLNYVVAHHNYLSGRGEPPYSRIDEDGDWGRQTDAMVRWFQKVEGLDADGIIGKMTGSYLLSAGDESYNGDMWNGPGYCYWKLPGRFVGS
ncbi:peptidoglycan-binding protein [Streptomyces sp. BK340]|uniref:peptidoglycan-binding domain-containing protein n=1 Tax=unclassified Streptomyces TaxID=2593676 RepID=UPI0011ABFEF0|nr:peptidoglycan-binding domain-containing protein [Streptomyces sp. BK340]TVZ96407.1 putative peptidoglycan binding protein [Streptomyces sp. BK340]